LEGTFQKGVSPTNEGIHTMRQPMDMRTWAASAAVATLCLLLARPVRAADKKEQGKKLFGLTTLHKIHLELSARGALIFHLS
jgi:hypothetical protein